MDYSSEEGFLSKAKWIFSSLSGIIMLWASRLPSPMQIPKQCHCRLQSSGLKTLIYSQGHPLQNPNHPLLIISSHKTSSPSPLPPSTPSSSSTSSSPTSSLFQKSLTNSSSWCSAIDDFLGTESGVYMNSDYYDYEQEMVVGDKPEAAAYNNNNNRYLTKRSQRFSSSMVTNKEYPPPLQHLTRVLTRHYENGNLVLKEKGMQQYFETTRENGRLILNLVQLEDNRKARNEELLELELLEGIEPIKEEVLLDDIVEYQETESDDDDDDDDDNDLMEEARNCEGPVMIMAALQKKMPEMCLEDDEIKSCGGSLGKCFTYTSSRRSLECEMSFGQPLSGGSAPLAAVTARGVTTTVM